MAEETDKAAEARRKALRKGEEDPVVVAQRFLNIYRQMHIFSPERKEAFNKMLLELSPEIRGLFSSMPGGMMLQDYVDDLAERNGVAKAVHTVSAETPLNEEANQQAQILATALAKAQTQSGGAAPVGGGAAKLSMDKDFAGEFSKIIGDLMQQQTAMQKAGLEKLALDLSKTQLFIAKNMKEGKEEQQREISGLCKAIAESSQTSREEQRREINELCRVMTENYQASREEQRRDIGELCKIIAQSQTALSASMGTLSQVSASASPQTQVLSSDDGTTRKLIELVIEGQKQLNSRLDKVEELSAGKNEDSRLLIESFEKSQAELIKSLNTGVVSNVPVQANSGNDEKLIQIISAAQEKLAQTLLSAQFQQNNTAQANTNANNIQITAPDNSAQMMLLVEKIASLQAANEKNLEKAITRAIEAQGQLYDKISSRQTEELARIIAEGLKESARPVYVATAPASAAPVFSSVEDKPAIPPAEYQDIETDAGLSPDITPPEENIELDLSELETMAEPITVLSEENIEAEPTEDEGAKKKKKKRRKKKKKNADSETMDNQANEMVSEDLPQSNIAVENISAYEEQPIADDVLANNGFDQFLDNTPEQSNISGNDFDQFLDGEPEQSDVLEGSFNQFLDNEPEPVAVETSADNFDLPDIADEDTDFTQNLLSELDKEEPPLAEDEEDDWGFGAKEAEETPVNDNQEEDGDWEWVYVEDDAADTDEETMDFAAIGDNSFIGSSDLYNQTKTAVGDAIIPSDTSIEVNSPPQIFDDTDTEDIDPYQNSILKD